MERKRKDADRFWFWRKMAWGSYLLGLPPIVAIFFLEKDWIFGSIELGGAPAMLCGLVAAFSRKDAPKWLDWLALGAVPVGLVLSVWDLGSFGSLTQLLEVAGSAGFLIGTYFLAKDREVGYYWFMLMNLTTGTLLYIQDYYLFVPQQILSVFLIVDAHRIRRKTAR